MGMRFRRSVRICKGVRVNISKSGASLSLGGRGCSVNVGRRGGSMTVGIPGSGLSYTTSLSSGSSAQRSTYRSSAPAVQLPSEVSVRMNDRGQVDLLDGSGAVIVDPAVIRKIKATAQYQAMKVQLEEQRMQKIDAMVQDSEEENERYINIYKLAEVVESEEVYRRRIEMLQPDTYEMVPFTVEPPSEELIKKELIEEAKQNVTAGFFSVKKKRLHYIEERLWKRVEEENAKWSQQKLQHEQQQAALKQELDARYRAQCEEKKRQMASVLQGDDSIWEAFDQWIASCELPVEMNIDYEWKKEDKVLMLDVDLPEIEDLPATRMTKSTAGNLREKKKTVSELRGEYATLVFGLALFISTNAFNLSPVIEKILISGYTQRRNKIGEEQDTYIFSLKLKREMFEGKDIALMDPKEFCMEFENRCNMTTTSLFREIKPYEEFA